MSIKPTQLWDSKTWTQLIAFVVDLWTLIKSSTANLGCANLSIITVKIRDQSRDTLALMWRCHVQKDVMWWNTKCHVCLNNPESNYQSGEWFTSHLLCILLQNTFQLKTDLYQIQYSQRSWQRVNNTFSLPLNKLCTFLSGIKSDMLASNIGIYNQLAQNSCHSFRKLIPQSGIEIHVVLVGGKKITTLRPTYISWDFFGRWCFWTHINWCFTEGAIHLYNCSQLQCWTPSMSWLIDIFTPTPLHKICKAKNESTERIGIESKQKMKYTVESTPRPTWSSRYQARTWYNLHLCIRLCSELGIVIE